MKNYAPSSLELISRQVCELAKKRDSRKLAEIADQYFLVDVFHTSSYSPLHLLAEAGDVEACEWLAKEWELDLNEAVEGFAANGFATKVEFLLAQGADAAAAAGGYALGGYFEEALSFLDLESEKKGYNFGLDPVLLSIVKKSAQGGFADQVQKFFSLLKGSADGIIFKKWICLSAAVRGFILGGFSELLNEFFKQNMGTNCFFDMLGSQRVQENYALTGQTDKFNTHWVGSSILNHYALGGYVEHVNKALTIQGPYTPPPTNQYAEVGNLLQINRILDRKGKEVFWDNVEQIDLIARTYIATCQKLPLIQKENALLRILSFTTKESLIQKLSSILIQENYIHLENPKLLVNKANKIRELMRKENLTFKQAKAYLKAMENCDLFETHHLVPTLVPHGNYLEILSRLANCSMDDARKICDVANRRIEKRMIDNAYTLFSQAKSKVGIEAAMQETMEGAEKLYQKRMGEGKI